MVQFTPFETDNGRRRPAVARKDVCMPIFGPEDESKVRELFDELERPVELVVAHGPEETPLPGARDIDFGAEAERIVESLAAISENISYRSEDHPSGIRMFPAITVLPAGEDRGVVYYGLPWGYELASLVGAIREAGRRGSSLAADSLERLEALDRDVVIDVFVTPT